MKPILHTVLPLYQARQAQVISQGGHVRGKIVPVSYTHLDVYKRQTQDLRVIHKDGQGAVFSRSVLPVVFVPLIQNPE